MYKKGASESHHVVLLAIVGVVALIGLVLAFGGFRGGEGATGAVVGGTSPFTVLQDQVTALQNSVFGLATDVASTQQNYRRADSFVITGSTGDYKNPYGIGNFADSNLGFKLNEEVGGIRVISTSPLVTVSATPDGIGQTNIVIPRTDLASGIKGTVYVHIHTSATDPTEVVYQFDLFKPTGNGQDLDWIVTPAGPERIGGVNVFDAFAGGNAGGIS